MIAVLCLLLPLAISISISISISIAIAAGGSPELFAMTVAIATPNSFLIPTHQVNALIMGPAGYKVIDFVRTGGIMTILFLVVSLVMMNVVF